MARRRMYHRFRRKALHRDGRAIYNTLQHHEHLSYALGRHVPISSRQVIRTLHMMQNNDSPLRYDVVIDAQLLDLQSLLWPWELPGIIAMRLHPDLHTCQRRIGVEPPSG